MGCELGRKTAIRCDAPRSAQAFCRKTTSEYSQDPPPSHQDGVSRRSTEHFGKPTASRSPTFPTSSKTPMPVCLPSPRPDRAREEDLIDHSFGSHELEDQTLHRCRWRLPGRSLGAPPRHRGSRRSARRVGVRGASPSVGRDDGVHRLHGPRRAERRRSVSGDDGLKY